MSGSENLRREGPQRAPLALAALALAVVLGVMAVGIALTHAQSKRQIRDYLKMQGESSAGFVSTYLSQQAARAVPFSTPAGRRVLSVAYPVAGGVLATFVEHTVAYKPHLVLLLDAKGKIITAGPQAFATTFSEADPALAKAAADATRGEITVAGRSSTFVVASVTGTPWHLVIAVPNDELFVSINGWAIWLPWIVFAVIAALASAVLVLFSRSLAAHGRLETLSSELARAVHTDALTGLANRRSLRGRLPQAWAYANRHREPISALMIDCDDFKQINDSYGHNTGDELLRAIAECMRTVFRASDIFGRWGGDEFLAVLPGTDLSGARAAGERLNKEVEALDMSRHGPCEQMTLSVGCASVSGVSTEALIVEADKALYRAKRQGHGHVAALDRV